MKEKHRETQSATLAPRKHGPVLYYLFCGTFILLAQGATALASPSIPPPPSISVPVWSLASPFRDETSMNIVTFATPVSVAPPKLWAVSLYTNTLTRDAFIESKVGVLQLLTPSMKNLVPLLGKRSGKEEGYSKREACREAGYGWIRGGRLEDDNENGDRLLLLDDENSSLDLLPDCASYIQLKMQNLVDAGDHEVAICEVVGTGVWDNDAGVVVATGVLPLDQETVLYTGLLRDEGII